MYFVVMVWVALDHGSVSVDGRLGWATISIFLSKQQGVRIKFL